MIYMHNVHKVMRRKGGERAKEGAFVECRKYRFEVGECQCAFLSHECAKHEYATRSGTDVTMSEFGFDSLGEHWVIHNCKGSIFFSFRVQILCLLWGI